MAVLKVFWTETAIKQRDLIFEYWNNRNKNTEYSKKLQLRIKKNLQILQTQPNLGKKSDVDEIRCLVLGYYSILYKSDNKQIIIISFWDNRQSPEKLFELLKNNSKFVPH